MAVCAILARWAVRVPSGRPSGEPSAAPSYQPSGGPSVQPSYQLTCEPSGEPSGRPSREPRALPSGDPTSHPSSVPSSRSSSRPSGEPLGVPSGEQVEQQLTVLGFGHTVHHHFPEILQQAAVVPVVSAVQGFHIRGVHEFRRDVREVVNRHQQHRQLPEFAST